MFSELKHIFANKAAKNNIFLNILYGIFWYDDFLDDD